ncbi:MAG: DinB family protein [Candidatus Korobacteraceae bacterium]
MPDLGTHYLDEVFRGLRGHKRLADDSIAQLSDQQFFAQPDPESNSVAIIVKHMAGNLRSRFTNFLTTDGEKPDRHRDEEFLTPSDTSRDQLLQWWEQNWQLLFDTINSLQPGDLERSVTIRGQKHSVLQALNRAVSHCAYHTGQITFLAKHWKGAEWKSLSVPKGQSEQFNAKMFQKHKTEA